MAVTVLSPWPDTSNNQLAISVLKDAIQPGASNDVIERLGQVASAMVEKFAPSAPDSVRSEALIRFAGYLIEAGKNDFGATRSDLKDIGDIKLSNEYVTNHGMAFRHSGAMALLAPWKVRRAGSI